MTQRDQICPRCEGEAAYETRTIEGVGAGYECARCHTRYAVAEGKPERPEETEPPAQGAPLMPSTSAKQQRFMGMQLAKKRAGEATDVDMSEKDLEDFAKKRKKPSRGSGPLTPLGQRTLAGFQKKWGEEEGRAKFELALENGVLDPDRMLASTKGDAATAGVTPAGKGELSGAASTASEPDSEPRRSERGAFQARAN